MRRALIYFSIALGALLVCAFLLSFWILRTDSGARFVWTRAVNALPQQLSAASFDGNLRDGVIATGVRYSDASTSISAKRVSFAAEARFFGLAVNINELHVSDVDVQPVASAATQNEQAAAQDPGVPVSEVLSSLRLPLTLRVTDLVIDKARLLAGDGSTVFAFDRLGLDARWGEALTIERLQFAADQINVSGVASVALEAPYGIAVDGEFTSDAPAGSWLPAVIKTRLGGNLQTLEVSVESSNPAVQLAGEIQNLLDSADAELIVSTDRFAVPPGQEQPTLQLGNLKLRITGGINDYSAQLATQLQSEFAAPLDVTASLQGNLESLQVTELALASTDIAASGTGELNWSGEFFVATSLEVERFDPSRWLADWPATQFLRGATDLSYSDGRLQITRLQAEHSDSSASLAGTGVVDTGSGDIDVELQWQDLQWPLPPAAATIDSRSASLALKGSLDDWALNGEIALGSADLPQGRFVLAGSGSRELAAVQIKDSEVLGGRVVGNFEYAARDGGQWSAELRATNTRITPFLPAWPGQISADFNASGVVAPFALALDVQSLSGNVRGRDVAAKGALRLNGEQLRFDKLELRSGASSLQLDGDWQSESGVEFALRSASLSDLLPDVAGSLEAEGRVQAGDEWPQLTLALSGRNLVWQQWSAAELEASNTPADAAPFDLSVTARGLTQGSQAIDSAALSLQGSPEQHQLELALQRVDEALGASLQGGFSGLQAPDTLQWQGELTRLQFDGRDALVLRLRDAVALKAGADSAGFEKACLDVSEGGALCAFGELAAENQYRATIEMTDLPLNLLRSFTGTTLKFNQLLSGSLELATGPRGRPSGSGRIDMTPGQILNEVDDRLSLRTRAGFAAFTLQDGQLLAGEIKLPFSDAAEIAGEFRVIDITEGENSPIAGQLAVVVRDLGVGARILPQIAAAGGSLDADITIDGTLGQPGFAGGLAIKNGSVMYAPLGLDIRDIELDSKVLPGNRVELTANFSAGDGKGRITSSADYLQGLSRGFEVSLVGENLKIIDLPDLSAVINPDLQLGIRGDDVRINGKVVVPAARIASVAFVNSGESESEDVVYVGPRQPAGAESAEPASKLNYSGSVVLELGNDVVIDLDVAEARLRGSTTYRWDGDSLPMANGSFAISGKFEAYGQLLEITEGTIRYVNAPASDPQLRIRAEREIFGNSQVRRAGVFVTGSAQRPKLEVYTNPATSSDRALTLLVTGSDFNYEQGVGAVDVGRYIAPRLYASYGIGLFDRENVISVRYDLAKGFGIKATSGKQAAGIDISYTIER
ncbi:MAG: translocation/assembly module TamB domain-containing protein [Woeseia sp.]